MKKKIIKLNWIEGKTKKPGKRISITAEEKNRQLNLKSVRCLPAIVCVSCITLGCPKLADCPKHCSLA